MIEAKNVSKSFNGRAALKNMSCVLPEGSIMGLVGSNGAGKSTLLRVLSGVYTPDEGSVYVDGESVFDEPCAKNKIAYIADELYLPSNDTMTSMARLYSLLFPTFDKDRFNELMDAFKLPENVRLGSFSKGMKRQAATLLALARRPKYIFFDETFDGLDPVMRGFIKSVICSSVVDTGACAVITTHSLRELEDTCDSIALLHNGSVIVENDLNNLKTQQFKVQIAFSQPFDKSMFEGLEISSFKKHGSVASMIVKGDKEEITKKLSDMNPGVLDILPLSLEEVFSYEMDALGYKFDTSILGGELK